MTTLKNHTYSYLIFLGILAFVLLYFNTYGRIFAIMFNLPFTDPDNDQFGKGKLHRWWYSHSIFPGLWITWAFMDILPLHLIIYPYLGFCSYAMIHLWGDLFTHDGMARIKLWPIKKTIDNRLWIGGQTILFLGLLFFFITI
jgi:hypothetical protein